MEVTTTNAKPTAMAMSSVTLLAVDIGKSRTSTDTTSRAVANRTKIVAAGLVSMVDRDIGCPILKDGGDLGNSLGEEAPHAVVVADLYRRGPRIVALIRGEGTPVGEDAAPAGWRGLQTLCRRRLPAGPGDPGIGHRDSLTQEIGIGVAGVVDDVVRGPFLDDNAEEHDEDAATGSEVADDPEVVADEDVGEVVLPAHR